jgi:hypothetical protein
MKKNYPRKKSLIKLSAVLLTCLVLFVIHSCKKNFISPEADTMQGNMINYINTHGGHAEYYGKKNYTARPNYDLVKDYLRGKITLAQLKSKIGC